MLIYFHNRDKNLRKTSIKSYMEEKFFTEDKYVLPKCETVKITGNECIYTISQL